MANMINLNHLHPLLMQNPGLAEVIPSGGAPTRKILARRGILC